MSSWRRAGRLLAASLVGPLLMTACAANPDPDPTPYPTPAPRGDAADASAVVTAFMRAWRSSRYEAMHRFVAQADRERYGLDRFSALLGDFDKLAGVSGLAWEAGEPQLAVLPPQPGPDGTVPPGTPPDGPVQALTVPLDLRFATQRFGEVVMERELTLVPRGETWSLRWSPQLLFPHLADDGTLILERSDPVRGQIVAQDGTVYAETREDGVRVYPQEWLAGQTIGYVSALAADELPAVAARDYVAGDVVGRSGLELGAEDLLRGYPGFQLATPRSGSTLTLLERPMVPGANLLITLRIGIQATADAALAPYGEAGTAVIDPRSGDVWALASAPAFNPNAMTLGTTLDGRALAAPSDAQRTNHAVMSAYPAGSSFKPFTLAAALQTGVASPATLMSCNGTWTFSGFTFHNYLDHRLAGLVSLTQAMAFSCNTTYMPLSIMVYEADETALTEVVAEFGFGQPSGMRFLADEAGILPDAAYFETAERWDGRIVPYGPFDQIQLAIGQGDFLGTPLQLANAYAAFGNGGTLWVPRLVVEARQPDGTLVEQDQPTIRRDVSLTDEQLDYVIESMKAVVNLPYGTAYPAFAGFGIQVAGKSGTAETGTPTPDAWFPAIAPADDPTISVATVLVHVALATGGSDAAPLVRRVMAAHFAGG